jgi:cold shock CspA family protein
MKIPGGPPSSARPVATSGDRPAPHAWQRGIIRRGNAARTFHFVKLANDPRDVFVSGHLLDRNNLGRLVDSGDTVEVQVALGTRGLRATAIRLPP